MSLVQDIFGIDLSENWHVVSTDGIYHLPDECAKSKTSLDFRDGKYRVPAFEELSVLYALNASKGLFVPLYEREARTRKVNAHILQRGSRIVTLFEDPVTILNRFGKGLSIKPVVVDIGGDELMEDMILKLGLVKLPKPSHRT
ncbi:hypothetical protein HYV81_01810 [Candidatus Woesearchaeota archaeon]|nr:hypothetical protein [Candidatus Woesearchaeota archaeon]